LSQNIIKSLFIALLVSCFFPIITAPLALLLGVIYAVSFGNPYINYSRKATHKLLQYSVIGLGFGMNVTSALQAGKSGFLYTIAGISFTFIAGYLIARIFKVEQKTAYLISAGTAICGGSAIAAVAPVIESKSEQTSVALGVVFILNSAALIIFPIIGHYLNLPQSSFGLWSAIAIHDTSSVVGAASQYGKEALATATTIKLTRALWIIPLTFASSFVFKSGVKKTKIPYFIFGFFAAMVAATYLPNLHDFFGFIYQISRQGLVITLFLIGSSITMPTLKAVGVKPLAMGVLLWIIVSTISLLVI